jgi:phosphatidylglycerophosphate synthase
MWLAHLLTLVRLPLLAILWVASEGWAIALAVGAAALSDLLDGPIARRALARTPPPHPAWWAIGGWLDPLVDKIFTLGALAALAIRANVPLYELALVATRELLLIPLLVIYLLARHKHAPLSADTIGKVTTAVQLCTLAALAVAPTSPICLAAAAACAALGIATIAHYVRSRAA